MSYSDWNGIRVISQNVNSLNLSTRLQLIDNLNRFDQKLTSFMSKNADFILLQDIRLGPDGHNIFSKKDLNLVITDLFHYSQIQPKCVEVSQ